MPNKRRPARTPGHNDASEHSGHNDRPDQPAATPPAARQKPSRRPDPLVLPPLPPPCDTPPLGSLSATIRLHGTEAQITALVEHLKRKLDVKVCIDAGIRLPDDAWDQFPPNFLTQSERSLVREDLRLSTTNEIMETLHIGRNTIHAYRTHIRSAFLSIDPKLRPTWMEAWLRRYPGLPGARGDK